ncbi:MAG: T9SS type A sorting domain-containing protein [Candidatus Marinimicrobia bacterium]|jgi:hypothetical protein|nr:T9SS type A sorting domain-containing protein [Candidatus Neomarinimicrobiota bacterium]MBT4281707.1 T9SS type A sorting domain-containing protein [Candidatus Neomarinimicrobiota bacterium]MBT5362862.1 T9SS type A sorting domain-containing protein [Candidatus Neomarinimicrobiota bacterium]MBT6862375.1 T9SS type A sorting domain-containing protein [Candidatus Neomarinimicrobiota bacterium]MBT7277847.1 T9SS type A sorting domain-containing protein [Candidatus Neomarinimicrobiota bacterium]
MKSLKAIFFGFILTSITIGQTLCPPTFVDALFFNEEVYLSWHQSGSYGDQLFDECFPICSLATNEMNIVNDVDNGNGGWFRGSDSTAIDCGDGMYPCEDGGNDGFSAIALYTDTVTTAIDSRLISDVIDLSNYSTAHIEFIESYGYPEDANDSNMVEVSTDGGATWTVVYSSLPWVIEDGEWFVTLDISAFVGNEILVAFRYLDSVGYGESWYVDDIHIWGGTGAVNETCGTFSGYNIYKDGELIDNTTDSWFSATGLENGTEYCFEITAVYSEGESETSVGVCSTPMGPFQVNPLALNFDEANLGDLHEMAITIQNFDTLSANYNITSIELSNIEVAMDVLVDAMEINFSTFTDPSASGFDPGVWGVNDSSVASSEYTPYDTPEDGGQFAFVNDDAIGDGADSTDAWLISDDITVSGYNPSFLLLDIFYPNPTGPCWTGNAYREDFLIHVSIDGGTTWDVLDSTMSTGWNWQSYMYNLAPYIGDATTFNVAFQYHDCGGEWGYGVAIDNVAIKEGDDFTWLTVSPYKGVAGAQGDSWSDNDSISVSIGVYGVYDGFTITEDLLVSSGDLEITVQIGVGVEVSIDELGITPHAFALHQNYPNPFNPETTIQIDLAKKSDVSVSIYNLMGHRVATLLKGTLDQGIYNIKWNGLSDNGISLPSGMYFYEMKSPEYHSVKKLVLVK